MIIVQVPIISFIILNKHVKTSRSSLLPFYIKFKDKIENGKHFWRKYFLNIKEG